MNTIKDKLENTKDKVVGEVKEAVGKMTNNDTMELEGRLQSAKSDVKKALSKDNIEDKAEDLKENASEKINDFIDKKEKKHKKD